MIVKIFPIKKVTILFCSEVICMQKCNDKIFQKLKFVCIKLKFTRSENVFLN